LLRRNVEILSDDVKPALKDDRMAIKNYEGQRVFARSMILYVDRSKGRIVGIGSHEKIAREELIAQGMVREGRLPVAPEPSDLEEAATGLPREILEDPNTARINA
jgi:hypothetical protein